LSYYSIPQYYTSTEHRGLPKARQQHTAFAPSISFTVPGIILPHHHDDDDDGTTVILVQQK